MSLGSDNAPEPPKSPGEGTSGNCSDDRNWFPSVKASMPSLCNMYHHSFFLLQPPCFKSEIADKVQVRVILLPMFLGSCFREPVSLNLSVKPPAR